jgi:hypothetical protein
MEKADSFIQEGFCQKKESVDFSSDREIGQFWKTWFGAYQTRNYRVSLQDEDDGALSQFCGVMFEIQRTTLAESLYNKFAHDLLYKGSSGPLTRKDEMVIDMSHGLSLCYGLCVMYMKDRLESVCNTDEMKEGGDALVTATDGSESVVVCEIVADGNRFFEDLASVSGKSTSFQDHTKASETSPDECHSINDLKGWLARKLD